jgi:MoxR-like ATPase
MLAMQRGHLARVEELTRIPSDVQDSLITLLSEKTLPIPELNSEVQATRGFNVVATANDRDRGVNELSSALKRRFNTVVMPVPGTLDEETRIVGLRVAALGKALDVPAEAPALEEIRRVVTIFRELRSGTTEDGAARLKTPGSTLSPAEAISVVTSALTLAAHFGEGRLTASDLAAGLVGAVIQDPVRDTVAFREYLETVVRERDGWHDLYRALRELL